MAEREYLERVKDIRNTEGLSLNPPLPINDLRLELSNTCNHSCIFCAHRKMTRPKRHMDESFAYRIMEEAYECGFRGLGFYASGEPFMTKNLKDYVAYAKRLGFTYVYIDSNGAVVSFEKIKEVIDAGLDSIKFSINGTDPETYKLIHGRDNFNRVIENLKAVYEYKKTLPRKLNVFVSFAVTKYTEDKLEGFLKKTSDYADDIITADVIDMGGYLPEVRKYLLTSRQTDFMEGMTVPCYTLWKTFIVTCEGYATACCADFQNYFAYADLNKETILEAWNNEYITKLRADHLAGNIEGSPCVTCTTGKCINWQPLRKELASVIKDDSVFEEESAKKRIEEYNNSSRK